MTYSRRRIALAPIWITLAIALAIVLAVGLARPQPAGAEIHEIIGALCNGKEKVLPPGQVSEGQSFLRALQATGFIVSIEETATNVKITFDVDVPNSKFLSAGFDLTIPDEVAPGVSLTLSPLPVPDPDFPAFANCFNF